MKKAASSHGTDEMRAEYDFTGAVRGKYYESFRKGSNVVLLEPDVSAVFPDSDSVNEALRSLARVARRSARVGRRSARPKGPPNKGVKQTKRGSR